MALPLETTFHFPSAASLSASGPAMHPSVLFTAIFALLVLPSTWVEAKPHKFNSNDGKSLEAEIIAATETGVTLRRTSDGKDFALQLDRLSEVDQAWIREWRVRQAPVPHPLGWKRVRIHADGPGVFFGHATLMGNGMREVMDSEEIYLPVGAWVTLQFSRNFEYLESLVRYDGAPDWYVEGAPNKILLRNRPDGPQRVAAVQYAGTEDGVERSREAEPLTARECAKAIETGAALCTRSTVLGDITKAKVNPESLDLQVAGESIRWEEIPRGVRALSVSGGGETMNLTGIEVLSQLEHLEIRTKEIVGMEALQKLPKLELLSVRSNAQPGEVAHLGKLTNLRHLDFQEQSSGAFPKDAFDCVGELTRLESAFLGSNMGNDKHINPGKAFRNCPNLTIYHLSQASINDKGEFLEKLPNLTEADFAGGVVPQERAVKLMDAGHFKHLRSLTSPAYYPLRNMPNLQRLVTYMYPGGKNFEQFGEFPLLRELTLSNARNEDLGKLAGHPAFGKVRTLTLAHPSADDFSALREMGALTHLVTFYGKSRRADFSGLASLETVTITAYSKLVELVLPAGIEDLRVSSADSLDLKSTPPLPHLRRLHLENCDALKTLESITPCPELTHLSLLDCGQLTNTAGIEKGKQIVRSVIQGCGEGSKRETEEKVVE